MAVSDHLKIASAELMKAADMIKIEIDDLRKQEANVVLDLDNKIAEHLRRIQRFEYELHHSDNPGQSMQAKSTISRMQTEVARMRYEIRESQRNIENAIRQKSGMVSGLESQARAIAI